MAKHRPKSQHTRAARRAASPSLDVDRSLTSLPRAESATVQRPSVLAERANAGIQKKQRKGKAMSKAQRLRQQKGMERAEAVLDRMEVKVAKSVTREKSVKARRADWEDTNRKTSMFQALQQGDDREDENNGDAMAEDTANAKSKGTDAKSQRGPAVSNLVTDDPAPVDKDDEIT